MLKDVKKVKLFVVLFVVAMIMGAFCACGSGEASSSNDAGKDSIKIEDIDWTVEEGVIDGGRYILLNYTNNSNYTISSFEMTFKEKLGVTDEEKEHFFAYVKDEFDPSDEELEELKKESFSMHAGSEKIVKPGESSKGVHCYYYEGYYYVTDINFPDLVEPDIATIKYIDGDKSYTIYYDFVSKKYSKIDEIGLVYQWSKTSLGDRIPKIEAEIVEVELDDEDLFMFDAYGVSLDLFESYTNQCREAGFVSNVVNYEGYYTATDSDGYSIDLYYESEDDSISVILSAPEN